MNPSKIIAEIGCNHMGNMEIAHEMILIAATFCKVDVIKFQKRCPRELLTDEQFNAKHPNPSNSFGPTYGAHREALELSLEQHAELKKTCEQYGAIYSTSVWDLTSAKQIVELNPKLIKIPSACNLNWEMLGFLAEHYRGKIHISFGMTTAEEEALKVKIFEDRNRCNDLVLYSCTSGYPVAFKDLHLLEIQRIRQKYSGRFSEIGFSGHHLGIAADIAAMALGADWIERHFTLDRTWKGTDHAASLEPDGLRRLVRDIKNTAEAIANKKTDIVEVEIEQRRKLKWIR
jgi:N-acetylneuraminate synthase